MTSKPRQHSLEDSPRCITCHRANHARGTYQGHWFTLYAFSAGMRVVHVGEATRFGTVASVDHDGYIRGTYDDGVAFSGNPIVFAPATDQQPAYRVTEWDTPDPRMDVYEVSGADGSMSYVHVPATGEWAVYDRHSVLIVPLDMRIIATVDDYRRDHGHDARYIVTWPSGEAYEDKDGVSVFTVERARDIRRAIGGTIVDA